MKKSELVIKVKDYIEGGSMRTKGEKSFLSFFSEFLVKLEIPADKEYDHWNIERYLPEIVVAAHELFYEGEDDLAKKWRAEYEQDTKNPVPHLTNIGESPIVYQAVEIGMISHAFERIIGGELGTNVYRLIETYCATQSMFVQQSFDVFARRVYQKGLFEIIRNCKYRGMNGEFGETWLRSYILGGRIIFTFCRKNGDEHESQVSFVGEENDPFLFSAGLQSIDVDVHLCVEMIMDVVKNWPKSQTDQKKIFFSDEEVKLDVVAAMEAALD